MGPDLRREPKIRFSRVLNSPDPDEAVEADVKGRLFWPKKVDANEGPGEGPVSPVIVLTNSSSPGISVPSDMASHL